MGYTKNQPSPTIFRTKFSKKEQFPLVKGRWDPATLSISSYKIIIYTLSPLKQNRGHVMYLVIAMNSSRVIRLRNFGRSCVTKQKTPAFSVLRRRLLTLFDLLDLLSDLSWRQVVTDNTSLQTPVIRLIRDR